MASKFIAPVRVHPPSNPPHRLVYLAILSAWLLIACAGLCVGLMGLSFPWSSPHWWGLVALGWAIAWWLGRTMERLCGSEDLRVRRRAWISWMLGALTVMAFCVGLLLAYPASTRSGVHQLQSWSSWSELRSMVIMGIVLLLAAWSFLGIATRRPLPAHVMPSWASMLITGVIALVFAQQGFEHARIVQIEQPLSLQDKSANWWAWSARLDQLNKDYRNNLISEESYFREIGELERYRQSVRVVNPVLVSLKPAEAAWPSGREWCQWKMERASRQGHATADTSLCPLGEMEELTKPMSFHVYDSRLNRNIEFQVERG